MDLRLRAAVPDLAHLAQPPPGLHRGELHQFRRRGGEQVRVHQDLPGVHRPHRPPPRNHDRGDRHFRENSGEVHHQGHPQRARRQDLPADPPLRQLPRLQAHHGLQEQGTRSGGHEEDPPGGQGRRYSLPHSDQPQQAHQIEIDVKELERLEIEKAIAMSMAV